MSDRETILKNIDAVRHQLTQKIMSCHDAGLERQADQYSDWDQLLIECFQHIRADAPSSLDHGGKAAIEAGAVVIRFPIEAMQSALDGAWGLNVFDRRQKVTDQTEFAKEFCRELNAESENGTTLIHRMADKAFVNMLEGGAFGFDEHEEQSL